MGRKLGRRRIKAVTVSPGSFNDMLDLDIGQMEREQARQVGAMSNKRDQLNASVNEAGSTAFKRRRR